MAECGGKLSALILYDRNRCSLPIQLRLLGHSMYPAIRHGQLLTCKFSQNINIGDIIVFWKADRLVAHRVVSSYCKDGQEYYIEKGDNSLSYSSLKKSDVLGKVIAIDGEKTWLSTDIRAYIVNYVVAKVSYGMAILRANRVVVARKVFRKKYLLESSIGNLVCRCIVLLLLRLVSRSR
jgi:signal peptidase I